MRHQRLAAALSSALVLGVIVGGCTARGASPDPVPDAAVGALSPSSSAVEPSQPPRPDPTYDPTPFPSGLVVRLPERDVELPADTSCWTDEKHCGRALLPRGSQGPDVGTQHSIDFWFARPGWSFTATFRRAGETCPRATTVEATRTDDQWFRLRPAALAGTYTVDVHGEGPEGAASSRFVWTTTSDGPVDRPQAAVMLAPRSRGPGSHALEVMVEDLAFQPAWHDLSTTVDVRVTSADGRRTRVTAPLIAPSLDCGARGARGHFYYQREWLEDLSVLGRRPYDLEVAFQVRGTRYVGTAAWPAPRGRSSYVPLELDPPLPAAGTD